MARRPLRARWRAAPLTAVAGAVVAVLATAPSQFAAAGPTEPHRAPAAQGRVGGALQPLVRSAAERLQVADRVAAAKWITGQPVADTVREQQVLDSVARRARARGIDPEAARRIFRDQIEASKLVQRALHERWTAHFEQAPTVPPAPDETRPAIDRIDADLLEAIATSTAARAHPACTAGEAVAASGAADDLGFDAVHRVGLSRALRSVCG